MNLKTNNESQIVADNRKHKDESNKDKHIRSIFFCWLSFLLINLRVLKCHLIRLWSAFQSDDEFYALVNH